MLIFLACVTSRHNLQNYGKNFSILCDPGNDIDNEGRQMFLEYLLSFGWSPIVRFNVYSRPNSNLVRPGSETNYTALVLGVYSVNKKLSDQGLRVLQSMKNQYSMTNI